MPHFDETLMHESNAIVMDNGTGYTKLGYSGNNKPQLMIPTVILNRTSRRSASDEYDFFIGDEALSASGKADVARTLSHPIRHGQVESWDLMESYWQHCFFRYLRCDPEQHRVLLTEPPLNSPENREATAEIMFETFNVPALHIAVQAVLALAASWLDPSAKDSSNVDKKSSGSISKTSPLTGTVVDSGDGVTHIIPVVDGYAISSAIKHVPMAGREITMYLQQLLRDRPDVLRFEDSLNAASRLDTMEMSKNIKANLCYAADDPVREMLLYDREAADMRSSKYIKRFRWEDPRSGIKVDVPIGCERFMAPEVFFNPDLISNVSLSSSGGKSAGDAMRPLPVLVDSVIQACPIDCRRALYGNIVLSGGSTMFSGLRDRLETECIKIVSDRLAYTTELQTQIVSSSMDGKDLFGIPSINVVSHTHQRHAVWTGGSLLASMGSFPAVCHTRAQYDEYGPSICRESRVFSLN